MNQHPDDLAVDKFATAMKEKLAQARAKGRGGWEECAPADLSAMLYEHVAKGDPRDVANFCMFIWHHGQPITPHLLAHLEEPLFQVCQRNPLLAELWQAIGNDAEVVAHVYGKNQREIDLRLSLLNHIYSHPKNVPESVKKAAKQKREMPMWPVLSADERWALERFQETTNDSEGYDVPKGMMRRLAEIGVVHHTSRGIYGITKFGHAVLQSAPKSDRIQGDQK